MSGWILWGIMVLSFIFMYWYLSTINPAYKQPMRKLAVVKYKTSLGRIKYKVAYSKKFILKEFLYTKSFVHVKTGGTKNIIEIYFFDRDGKLYSLKNNRITMLKHNQVKGVMETMNVSFLDIYNFMSANRFLSYVIDQVKRNEKVKDVEIES